MTPELTALTLAALLQVVQIGLFAVSAQKQVGGAYAASPRDEPKQLTGVAGRLQRALDNHFEGLVLFTIACVVITLSGQSSRFTAACAWLYLAARVLYIPAYARGWTPGRSIIWTVGFLATIFMLLAALI
ncbi:MAPEG family protein [Pseudodonghicola sp.]|uniref:MAPEG family protein n=1 Tax=Pseudodonghicola sp. TaxID=1969463 RepID=UPI003A98411F